VAFYCQPAHLHLQNQLLNDALFSNSECKDRQFCFPSKSFSILFYQSSETQYSKGLQREKYFAGIACLTRVLHKFSKNHQTEENKRIKEAVQKY
jgi:hypothetical protein